MDRLRARARDISVSLLNAIRLTDPSIRQQLVETAILRGMVEALEAEPDQGMLKAGAETIAVLELSNPDTPMGIEARHTFRAMAAERVARMKGATEKGAEG